MGAEDRRRSERTASVGRPRSGTANQSEGLKLERIGKHNRTGLTERLRLHGVPWLVTALALFLAGTLIILLAGEFIPGSVPAVLLNSLGVALWVVTLVNLLHEFMVARRVRDEFHILGDFVDKGVQRLCTQSEMTRLGEEQWSRSASVKATGLGLSWVFADNAAGPQDLLRKGGSACFLIPDPDAPSL